MQECPNCGSDLRGATSRERTRTGEPTGRSRTGAELVTCPSCDEVIDGFSPH